MIMGRPCLIGQLWSRTEGKPAVRNLREDRGDVGIIRSPVRASILPDLSILPYRPHFPLKSGSAVPAIAGSRGAAPVRSRGCCVVGMLGGREKY
jgi:hypothetical protein